MSDKATCSQCGRTFVSPANHWASSSSCDFPEFTRHQHELTTGVLLAGGQLHAPSRNHTLSLTSTRESFLSWIDNEFGILGKGRVYHVEDAEDVASRFNEIGNSNSEMDASDVYEWASRTHPTFNRYYGRWFDDEGTRDPPNVPTTPTVLRVWYANRGSLRREDRAVWATLRTPDSFGDDWIRDTLSAYAPRITHTETGLNRVMLRRSEAFFNHIGWDAPPGCDDRWPTPADTLASPTGNLGTCPECGREYEALGQHWAQEKSDCTPELTTEQRDVVHGILAVRGNLTPISQSRNRSSLVIKSTNRRLLEWLSDQLSWLAHDITENVASADRPDEWASGDFETVCRLQTHTHPTLSEKRRDWYEGDEKRVPVGDLDPTVTLLRTMYVVAGNTRATGSGNNPKPSIRITRSAAPDEEWLALLADFDPVIHRPGGSRVVHIRDGDGFFDYIGEAPHGLEAKWERDQTDETDPLVDVFSEASR